MRCIEELVVGTYIGSNVFQLPRDLLCVVQNMLLEHFLRVKVHYKQTLKDNAAIKKKLGPFMGNCLCEEYNLKTDGISY